MARGHSGARLAHFVRQDFDVLPAQIKPHRFGDRFLGRPTSRHLLDGRAVLALSRGEDALDEARILHRVANALNLNNIDSETNNHS